jgi:hypothetical protein
MSIKSKCVSHAVAFHNFSHPGESVMSVVPRQVKEAALDKVRVYMDREGRNKLGAGLSDPVA